MTLLFLEMQSGGCCGGAAIKHSNPHNKDLVLNVAVVGSIPSLVTLSLSLPIFLSEHFQIKIH